MTFGEKLYRLRTEQGISQESLARKLGVSRQAISRWELGEVIPDTANVLAVSRLFRVSTDYLLREDCLSGDDIPPVKTTELSLQDRQYAMGEGILLRFLLFGAPGVWHRHHGDEDTRLLIPFLLCWTVFFGIMLAINLLQLMRYTGTTLSGRLPKRLLRNDILALCSLCFLPLLLSWLPGNFHILFAVLAAVPFLQETWQLLRKAWNLPEPPLRKRWRKP